MKKTLEDKLFDLQCKQESLKNQEECALVMKDAELKKLFLDSIKAQKENLLIDVQLLTIEVQLASTKKHWFGL